MKTVFADAIILTVRGSGEGTQGGQQVEFQGDIPVIYME